MEPAVYPGFHTRKCQDAKGTCRTCGSDGMRNAADASSSHRTYALDEPRAMHSRQSVLVVPARVPKTANGHHHETTNESGRLLELEVAETARPPECPGPTWTSR